MREEKDEADLDVGDESFGDHGEGGQGEGHTAFVSELEVPVAPFLPLVHSSLGGTDTARASGVEGTMPKCPPSLGLVAKMSQCLKNLLSPVLTSFLPDFVI